MSYFGNLRMIEDVDAAVAKYDAEYAELGKRDPKGTDLGAILPPLDTLRAVRGGYDEREIDTPVALTFGLYQGGKLSAAAIDAYGRALNGLLRPRLLARLEREMRQKLPPTGQASDPDLGTMSYLYDTLKVYLMLDGQGHLKPDLVEAWLRDDVGPDELAREPRERLGEHLHAMLDLGPPREAPAMDADLVAQVRNVLNKRTLAEYVFDRLLASPAVKGLKLWTVADHAGPTGGRGVFTRTDGKDLNAGVDGVYTWDGYHKTFRNLIGDAAQYAPEDHWVLGREDAASVLDPLHLRAQGKLAHDLLELYLARYIRQWDVLLGALTLKPFHNADEERAELSDLSSPVSPLRELFRAIDEETQLSRPSAEEQAAVQAENKVVGKLTKNLSGYLQYLLLPGMSREHIAVWTAASDVYEGDAKKQGGGAKDPLKQVDEHFARLHSFVTATKDGGSELDAAIGKIGEIYKAKLASSNAANPGELALGALAGGGGGGGAAADLREAAKNAPDPIKAMLQSVAQGSAQVSVNTAAKQLSDEWRSEVQPRCVEALSRYPFIRTSAQDAPPRDFKELLGPGGKIDKFFDKYLKQSVDMSQRPWRWQSPDHTKLGLPDNSLSQFQNAAEIRDALFGAGGPDVSVVFTIESADVDPAIGKVTVDIGGDSNDYIGNGPPVPVHKEWPGKNGNIARITLIPTAGGRDTEFDGRGPWSLLRLLDKGRVSGEADSVKATFSTEAGNSVTFSLLADSTRNPFTLKALRDFRCPAL
jgi:type VI secretion system protein ImpL